MTTRPPTSFLVSRAARVALARQRFFEEGIVPTGVVTDAVFQSWSRCLRLHHRPTQQAVFEPVTASRAHLAMQKNRQLLGAWLEISPKLEAVLGSTSCAAMLTDHTGVLIGASCVGRAHEKLMPVATRVGVNLSEEAVGTTAPGVSARTGKAVCVIGADHFFESVTNMECAAAPIRDITGAVAGVLDLSSEAISFNFDAAAVTGLYAGAIENRLLIAQSTDHLVVRFQVAEELLDSALVGLIGIDSTGRMAWQNRAARSLLGLPSPDDADPDALEASLNLASHQLASLPALGAAMLTLPNGLVVWARAQMQSPDGFRRLVPAMPQRVEESALGSSATLRDSEREVIIRTLQACGGNVSKAASSLGVSRNLIYRRLRNAPEQALKATDAGALLQDGTPTTVALTHPFGAPVGPPAAPAQRASPNASTDANATHIGDGFERF